MTPRPVRRREHSALIVLPFAAADQSAGEPISDKLPSRYRFEEKFEIECKYPSELLPEEEPFAMLRSDPSFQTNELVQANLCAR